MGYSSKNPHPHDGRHSFLTPISTWISKTAWGPFRSGFQVQRPPSPPTIWISIKLLDTVILLYTQCRRILLGTWMIFLLNKSQFSVNSVFVVKGKIPFSHVQKWVCIQCEPTSHASHAVHWRIIEKNTKIIANSNTENIKNNWTLTIVKSSSVNLQFLLVFPFLPMPHLTRMAHSLSRPFKNRLTLFANKLTCIFEWTPLFF